MIYLTFHPRKKEQPVFEGDNLNWFNLDENEIDVVDDDDPTLDATPAFCTFDQQPEDIHSSECESEDTCRL